MSRIQDILNKAERDGTARRTRPLEDGHRARPEIDQRLTGTPIDQDVRAGEPFETPVAEKPKTIPPRLTRRGEISQPSSPVEDTRRASPTGRDASRPTSSGEVRTNPGTPPRSVRTIPPEGASAVAPMATSASRPVHLPSSDPGARGSAELDPHLVAALAPTSLAAEQYRSLRTRLKQVESGRVLRAIAITSPSKGDGKSLTAANLALTMAQEVQQRVLLVDCDLRRPTVHRLFGLDEGTGLVDVLMNAADLDQALVWLPEHHLTVLPAGIPPSNPAELLGSATMRRTLDNLRTRFDRILIDVPPVAPLADLHVLAPLVDGLLMIVRAGMTSKPAIERALGGLDPMKVLGLILNEAGGENADNYAYAYDGYGYIAG